jgi:predicted dehydrogenase
MPEVNVALIGYSFMGRAHSNAYRQVAPFFQPRLTPRMKVLCGRNAAGVRKAARVLGWEETATDWREVIERDDIDLVDVSTPGDSHAEIAIAAARAGKAVFCEKPLANTLAEAKAMLAAVKKAGVTHMICHNYRRIPAVQLARQLISSGRLGRIHHYRATYLQDWIVDPKFPLVWRLQKNLAGSGALGDLASHSVDLARFLVGEITEVSGALQTFVKRRPLVGNPKKKGTVTVDDAAVAVVRFANGALGSVEASRMAPGRRNWNRFEINGSEGSLAFDLERLNELEVFFRDDAQAEQGFRRILVTEREHPYVQAWWPPGHIIGWEHTFTHTVFDLLQAMDKKKVPTPSFEDGVRNQAVLHAIERSATTRRWVTVKV